MDYILKDQNAVLFEAGYSCDNEILLVLDGQKFFLTDARYAVEAEEAVKSDVSVICEMDLLGRARLLLRKFRPKSVVYDPFDFCVADFERLSQNLGVKFIKKPHFSWQKRIIKSEAELEILRKAAQFGAKCFDEFADFVRQNGEGMSESELHFHASLIFRQKNALGLSFDPIVAINANAAKAHALPGETRLKKGDLLLLDAGVRYLGFCSDRTRTACFDEGFNFSKTQKFKSQKQQEVYEIVKLAQEKSIAAVRAGVLAKEVDAAAREVITAAGYGEYFIHSTGHGVGLDIHELPFVNKNSKTQIETGMVFSIEPGIYLPGEFGVRIEDVVVAQQNGAEIL